MPSFNKPENPSGIRGRLYPISPILMKQIMTVGYEVHVRCIEGVPADALVADVRVDIHLWPGLFLLVVHPSFDEVPYGQVIPVAKPAQYIDIQQEREAQREAYCDDHSG